MSVPQQKPVDGIPAPGGGVAAHPTALALLGFFAGMALMLAIPATFAAVATLFASTADLVSLAPLGLIPFAIPLVLIVIARTRLFGCYLLIGMVSTALVVAIVAGAVLVVLIKTS